MGGFVAFNRKISQKIYQVFPQTRFNIFEHFFNVVADFISQKPNQIIADIGGGKRCQYSKLLNSKLGSTVIAVDISPEELLLNHDADLKVVADVTKEIPLPEESVDIITTKLLLEHLENIEPFFANSQRILKTGGYLISLLPGKFALFAMINQLIPNRLAKMLLNWLRPEFKGVQGFKAYYHQTYYSALVRLLKKYGFEIRELKLGYSSAGYFDFFVPLFSICALYELVVYLLRIKNLSGYIFFVAQKSSKE